MRAAIFRGAGLPLAVEIVADPVPGEGELVIRVERCGVCGTDLHMTSGHGDDVPLGTVIGHEFSGEIVAAGKDAGGFGTGERVTAMPCRGCGVCARCREGYPIACTAMEGMVGGFGEYMRVAASSAISLPAGLSALDGALVEPLAVGLHGVRLAKMTPGSRVAVLGAGSIGLAVIYWARHLGAGCVVAMSRSARRAPLANDVGAQGFEAFGEGEGERLAAALGGPPDILFECTGAVGSMQKAVELVAPGGTIVSLGFCAAPDALVPALATWKRATMRFSFAYSLADFQESADMLDAGHVEPRLMVSRTVGLDAFPAHFEALRAGSGETKLHLDPWASA
ncbi:alcohol dehydrogenase catalytic domain-containing protein [Sphingopyxis sp. CCNWLW253]|uniref:alcohol dehydrogenase catalytic domain-containing protein n=1 Tax=unclassified Sphingopyxis TaxID=2614943 RepID=UPI003013125E